jgi:hypothetical protein
MGGWPSVRTSVAATVLAGVPATAVAASPADQFRTVNVNYVYASTLGFGGYSLAGLDASVYTLPFGHSFLLDAGGTVLRVTLPVQLGLYNFHATDTNGTHIAIAQQSLAIVPGAELRVPVTANTVLAPFAAFGAAHAFGVSEGGADSWIYSGGVRSVTQWPLGSYTLSVGEGVVAAGDQTVGGGFGESYVALETGLELRRPLGFRIRGITPDLGVYAVAYYYAKPLQFTRFLAPPLQVRAQGEVGLTLGTVEPIEGLRWLGSTRIGVGYVFGDGLQVWHVVFGFPL